MKRYYYLVYCSERGLYVRFVNDYINMYFPVAYCPFFAFGQVFRISSVKLQNGQMAHTNFTLIHLSSIFL